MSSLFIKKFTNYMKLQWQFLKIDLLRELFLANAPIYTPWKSPAVFRGCKMRTLASDRFNENLLVAELYVWHQT